MTTKQQIPDNVFLGPVENLQADTGTTGQVLTVVPDGAYPGGKKWQPRTPTASLIAIYSTYTKTLPLLANNATYNFSINIEHSIVVQRLKTSVASWIKIYPTLADLTADSSRVIGVDPTFGVAGEPSVESAPGVGGYPLTDEPQADVVIHNGDAPRAGRLYVSVTNKSGGSASIDFEMRYLPLEGNPATLPADVVTDLVYWFKPFAITGHVLGDAITPLLDFSGGARNGTAVGTTPTFDPTAFNGHPALRYNGGHYTLPAPPGGITGATIIIAMKIPGAGGPPFHLTSAAFGNSFPSTSGATHIFDAFATNNGGGQQDIGAAGLDTTQPFIYAATSIANEWTAYMNGIQIYQKLASTFDGGFGSRWLGQYNQGGFFTVNFDGYIGEVRVYSRKLSSIELADAIANVADQSGVLI